MVFLSYAHEDIELVKKLYKDMLKYNVNVWFDKESIHPGKWKGQIEKAIAKSKYFMICISNSALLKTGDKPGFQDEELQYAYNIALANSSNDFIIIPVRIEKCGRGDHRLSSFQQFDLFDDWEKNVKKIISFLEKDDQVDRQDNTNKKIDEYQRIFLKIEAATYARDFNELREILSKDLEIIEQDKHCCFLKGMIYTAMSDYDNAIIFHRSALSIDRSYIDSWWNLFMIYNYIERFDEAIIALDKVIKNNPKDWTLYIKKGKILVKVNQIQSAILAFKIALKYADKENKNFIYFRLGNLYRDSSQLELAENCFSKAIQLDSTYYRATYNLGNILKQKGDIKGAIECFKKVLRVKPDFYIAIFALSELYTSELYSTNEKQIKIGIDYLNSVIEIEPDYYKAWNNKGIALKRLNQFTEALKCFNTAIEISPFYIKAINNKIDLLRSNDSFEKISEFMKFYIEIDIEDESIWYQYMKAQVHFNKFDDAAKSIDKLMSINNKRNEYYFIKGRLYFQKKNFNAALDIFNSIIKKKNTFYIPSLKMKSDCLMKLGRIQESHLALSIYEMNL